jgi:hypothetical protein
MVDVLTDIPEDEEISATPVAKRDAVFWIKKISYRLWRISAEFGAVVMGLAIVWLYALSYLLTQQSVDVSGARSNLGLLFADAVAGAGVDISEMRLDWYPATDDIVFTGVDVVINSDDGTEMQRLAELSSFFPLSDVRKGILLPRKLVLNGGEVSWVENKNGRIKAGLGSPETLGRLGPLWEGRRGTSSRSGSLDLDGVEFVEIKGATANYHNETNGLDVVLKEMSFLFKRESDVLKFEVDGQLVQTEGAAIIPLRASVVTNENFQSFDVAFKGEGINLAQIGPERGRFERITDLDAPAFFEGQFDFDRETGLQSAKLDFEIREGAVAIPGLDEPYAFDSFVVSADLNAGQSEMTISTFDLQSSKVDFSAKGELSDLGAISDGDINSSPLFDLNFETLALDFTPRFEAPLRFKAFDVAGRVDADEETLEIESFRLDRLTHQVSGSFFTKRDKTGSLEILRASGDMSGSMSPEELLQIWPVKFADGARRWIERSVIKADIDSLSFEADYGPNDDGVFSEKTMNLDWTVRDADVRYISTMTPLTGASGKARISDNALEVELEQGQIGSIVALPSRVDIPRLRPKGGDMIIQVNAAGNAPDMLSLINEPPFKFADRYGVDPATIAGQGEVSLTITRPLLEFFDQNRIQYAATGNMTGVSAPFRIGPHQLKNGDLSLDIDKSGLRVDGPVNIGPWRTNLEWREVFDNGLTPTRYRVFGEMQHTILDDLGLGLREYFDGTIGVEINATGQGVNITSATLQADLAKTEIAFGEFWNKPLDAPGQVKASLTRGEQGTDFQSIAISAPELEMKGRLSLTPNYALRELILDQIKMSDFIEGSLQIRPDSERELLSASLSGARLDVSSFLDQSLTSQTAAVDVPLLFSAQVDTLVLDPLFETRNTSLLYSHNGLAMTSLRLSGDTDDGPITADLKTDSDNNTRTVNASIPNAAIAAEAFLGLKSLEGGTLTMNGNLPLPGEEGAYVGKLIIEDFTLREAPIMAQLLSLGSLTGLFDTLAGEGLGFDRFEAPFQLLGGKLSIRDASVYGPALGMSGEGNININEKTVDIDGALVPAYTANSLLGDIPVLGDLLVGKKGEGIFALSYTVEGPFEATQISVNPLSALTPGFLRGIFRKQRDNLPDMEAQQRAEELLEEAKKVAPEPNGN